METKNSIPFESYPIQESIKDPTEYAVSLEHQDLIIHKHTHTHTPLGIDMRRYINTIFYNLLLLTYNQTNLIIKIDVQSTAICMLMSSAKRVL